MRNSLRRGADRGKGVFMNCRNYSTYGDAVSVEITKANAIVRFDRGVNRNALDQATISALTQVARDLNENAYIHTVILTGAPEIFSAGIDLKDPEKWEEKDQSLVARRIVAQRGSKLCSLWENLPQLTIAAIEGLAVGGSVSLALACDWRVAGDSVKFYLPEAKVGLNMGWGAIPRMMRIVGSARTEQMILLSEMIDSATALQWRLVDFLCKDGEAVLEALELVRRLEHVSPAITRMTKEAVLNIATALDKHGIYMDADQALVARDSIEGIEARVEFVRGNKGNKD